MTGSERDPGQAEASSETEDHRILGPGRFPPVRGKYEWSRPGARISIDREHASFPLADPRDPSHAAFLAAALEPARANPSIDDSTLDRLGAALVSLSQITPDATGLAGAASWSGPGASSWHRTVGHPRRGPAFAAELIVTAALRDRCWPAGNAAGTELTIETGADRIDFGIKLLGAGGRRTVEADVLVQGPRGVRAVDVKHAQKGRYRGHLTASHAAAIAAVIKRSEIDSFHVVTGGRLSSGFARAVEDVNNLLEGEPRVFWHTGVDASGPTT
jgi:hypothetical protein